MMRYALMVVLLAVGICPPALAQVKSIEKAKRSLDRGHFEQALAHLEEAELELDAWVRDAPRRGFCGTAIGYNYCKWGHDIYALRFAVYKAKGDYQAAFHSTQWNQCSRAQSRGLDSLKLVLLCDLYGKEKVKREIDLALEAKARLSLGEILDVAAVSLPVFDVPFTFHLDIGGFDHPMLHDLLHAPDDQARMELVRTLIWRTGLYQWLGKP